MSSKPIQFNTEMVKAILDGGKTQFRKVIVTDFMNIEIEKDVMPQEVKFLDFKRYCPQLNFKDNGNAVFQLINRTRKPLPFCDGVARHIDVKPKYKVGDILYVKEKCVDEYPNGFCFKEDYEEEEWNDKYLIKQYCNKLNARIFLKVTSVRVERLQDISVRDIEKESGWRREIYSYSNKNKAFLRDYCDFWNSTTKDGYKWGDNPYVFVYEFERIERQ